MLNFTPPEDVLKELVRVTKGNGMQNTKSWIANLSNGGFSMIVHTPPRDEESNHHAKIDYLRGMTAVLDSFGFLLNNASVMLEEMVKAKAEAEKQTAAGATKNFE